MKEKKKIEKFKEREEVVGEPEGIFGNVVDIPIEGSSKSPNAKNVLTEGAVVNRRAQIQEDSANNPMSRFGVETKTVFGGAMINKRFSSELINQKRFVWLDPDQKKLFWSKTHSKDNSPKSIDLATDVTEINIKNNNLTYVHRSGKKQSVEIEIIGTLNDRKQAEDWYKVSMSIFSNS